MLCYYYIICAAHRQQISLDAEQVKQFRGKVFDQKGDYAKQKKKEIEIRKKMAAFKEVIVAMMR